MRKLKNLWHDIKIMQIRFSTNKRIAKLRAEIIRDNEASRQKKFIA